MDALGFPSVQLCPASAGILLLYQSKTIAESAAGMEQLLLIVPRSDLNNSLQGCWSRPGRLSGAGRGQPGHELQEVRRGPQLWPVSLLQTPGQPAPMQSRLWQHCLTKYY